MYRHHPLPQESQLQEAEDRQTMSLAAVALVLLLLVAGLFLVHALYRAARMEDCLMAGRRNCDRIVVTH